MTDVTPRENSGRTPPTADHRDHPAMPAPDEPTVIAGEVVVELMDGWTLRSSATDRLSGDYVRLVDDRGNEYAMWEHTEWAEDPVLVMGAIINAAAGLRPGTTPTTNASPIETPATSYVLVVRDPDASNTITTDGDVHTIDIDLGSGFTRSPQDTAQAVDWAGNLAHWLDRVPITSPVYAATIDTVRHAVADHPEALAVVAAYQDERFR